MKKFFGTILIVAGFVYGTWTLFGGGIDYYTKLNTLEESFAMEFLNLISNLAVITVFFVLGFRSLLRSS